jgi:hypothetical protein
MANEFKIKKGLIVTGASGGTVVDIQGSQGQLFSVTDNLSGSIFAVSDISGVPIFDVNSSGLSTFDGNVTFTKDVNITQTTDVGALNTTTLDDGSAVGLSLTYPTSNVVAGDGLAIAIGITGRGRSYIANSNTSNNLDASNLEFYTEGGGVINKVLTLDQNKDATFADNINVTNSASIGSTVAPTRTLDVRGTGMSIFGTGGNTELMLRGQVEGTGTVRNVGSWHWSVRADVGGDNDDLKLLRFETGSYRDTAMQISNSTGNIGIGANTIPNADYRLILEDTNEDILRLHNSTDGLDALISFTNPGGTLGRIQGIDNGGLGFDTGDNAGGINTNAMFIDNSGNVGIGMTSPSSFNQRVNAPHLVVGAGNNSAGLTLYSGVASQGSINFADGTTTSDQYTGGILYVHGSDNYMTFYTNGGGEKMRIGSDGAIKFNTYNLTNQTGTPTYLLGTDATGNVVKTLTGVPTTGTTQFFNQSNEYNNPTPGISSFGDVTMDSTVSFFSTGVYVSGNTRGITWTGEHYILTEYIGGTAKFYDNNFILLAGPKAKTITLPTPASGGQDNHHGAAWDGRYLYCVLYGGTGAKIVGYDLDNGTTTATIVIEQLMNNPDATYAIEYAEGHLYTVTDGEVSQYKLAGKTITHVFTSGNILSSIEAQAITYDGSYLWITQNAQNVYKVNLDCTLEATITTGYPPNNTGWGWNGQNINAVNYQTGEIYIVRTAAKRFDTEEFLVMGGNVGIGVTDPQAKLEVKGASASPADGNEVISVTNTTGGSKLLLGVAENSYGWIQSAEGGTYRNLLLNPLGGNVGIGTTSPVSTWLSGFDPSTGNGTFKLTSEGWIVTPYLTGLAGYYPGQGARPIVWADDSGTNLQCWDNSATDGISLRSSNGTTRLFVKENGNVGIGTTSPNYLLELSKTAVAVDTYSGINLQASNYGYTIEGGLTQNIGGELIFSSNSVGTKTPRVKFAANGNVGIGTTTPLAKLDIQGTQGQLFSVTDNLSGSIFAVADISGVPIFDVNSSGVSYFDGKVGIGVTSPTAKLQVAGTTTYNSDTIQALRVCDATDVSKGIHIGFDVVQNAGVIQAGDFGVSYRNLSLNPNVGNVGIGTTSPERILHLDANQGQAIIQLDKGGDKIISIGTGSSATNADDTIFQMFNEGSELVRIFTEGDSWLNGGDVGIGTTSPTEKLEVNGTIASIASSLPTFKVQGSDVNYQGRMRWDTNNNVLEFLTRHAGTYYSDTLVLKEGKVGIRTNNPSTTLSIQGTSSNGINVIGVGTTATRCYLGLNSANKGYLFIAGSSGENPAVITSQGDSYISTNLGVGNTSPDKLLHVGDGAASLGSPQGAEIEGYNNTLDVKTNEANSISDFTAALNLFCDGVAGSSGTGTGIYFRAKTGGGGGGEYTKGRIQGAVYTSWTTNTDATRTSKLVIQTTNSGTHADRVTILGTGATTFVSTVTATNFILSSDEALKENIKDISNKHIDVSWKSFELKSEPGVKRSGVIAQELETKHPEFVRTNEDGLKSVAYIDLLIAKIAELEARLEKAGL